MKCPNCDNTTEFEETNDGIKIYKMPKTTVRKYICLKCGYKFSEFIGKGMVTKNE
jgi:hypothetical protein